jgi:hypothetical protein
MCGLHVVDSGTNIDGEESLEAELNNVLVNIGDDIWNSEDLVAFLDSGEQTRMCAIQSRFLAQEVCSRIVSISTFCKINKIPLLHRCEG